jgi:hypothetical protein
MTNPGQEQIKPETAALIASLAAASGLSVDDYLRRILEELAAAHGMGLDAYLQSLLSPRNGQPQAEAVNMAEIDQWLDELSEGTEHITPLPADFSRADIYGDHP